MLRWFEHRQVYEPSSTLAGSAADVGRPFEDVFFQAGDGARLHGWFFPAEKVSSRGHLTLLLLHGNTGNVSHRLDFYRAWLELGLNVFAFDYRGFGRSAGRPSEAGTYLDAQAACRWLQERQFAPEHVIVLGESLGGGVGSELALREPIGGLVLQNTFTNIPDIGSERYPWLPVRRLHSIHYNTLSKLPRIKVPILVMHSRGDRFIGFHHAERNFAAANNPKMFWEIYGTHMGMLEADRPRYIEGLERFLVAHVARNEKRPA